MSFLKVIFDFYINSSIHVALAVYAFTRITALYFGIDYQEDLDYFIFFATISGYNFVKYAGVAKLHHMSLTKNLRIIQLFSLVCFIAMCWYAYKLPIRTLLFFVPFGILTVLYAVPFLSGFQKNLRSIGHLKVLVIAFIWAATTVLLPIYHMEEPIEASAILLAVQRFLLVVVLILPFDIRDLRYDEVSLQTIPQRIGVAQTKRFGLALMLFALTIEFMEASNTSFKNVFMIFFFVILVFLMRAKEDQPKYYSSFFVEAIPIFWWLSLLMIS
ncbi:hypothetical protein RQM59_10460 [Flavobacteriaceae bacterium S356]|uniref:Prenyltransferase n=1 Tax=Asprobacillus argus TaxID=3076534 RepID=A0ABU3LGU1_9FLAO|nr:hypothetical protein [Flavobacteriaceae bacterium S356]